MLPFHSLQPFPNFYINRPDRRIVPLVALDELPSWLQIGNWDWADLSLYKRMFPAAFEPFPRLGEYDVICHNCCSHIDALHRSISQRSDFTQSSSEDNKGSPSGNIAAGGSGTKSCPGALGTGTVIHRPQLHQLQHHSAAIQGGFLPLLPLEQPLFHRGLPTPVLGMCYVDVRSTLSEALAPPEAPVSGEFQTPVSSSAPTSSRSPKLNPEAPDFSPGISSTLQSASQSPSSRASPSSPNGGIFISPVSSSSSMNRTSKDGSKGDDSKRGNAGTKSPPRSTASTEKSDEILLEELKRAVGIKALRKPTTPACRRNPPVPNSPEDKNKKPFHEGPKKKRRGRRRARKPVLSKRPGRRRVSFRSVQNSAAKRRARRGRKGKKEVAAGAFWHMMMVPQGPRR